MIKFLSLKINKAECRVRGEWSWYLYRDGELLSSGDIETRAATERGWRQVAAGLLPRGARANVIVASCETYDDFDFDVGPSVESIARRLGAADGERGRTWDHEVLRTFAEACWDGEDVPSGGPEMQAEADALRDIWEQIQSELAGE